MSNSPWATSSSAASATASTTPISTAAATAAAQAAIDHLNSPDWLANADKSKLLQDWNNESSTQTQLHTNAAATTPATSVTAYDAAVAALSAGLIAAGAPSNWASIWPDGSDWNHVGIKASVKGWWAAIATQRTALQNSIAQAQATKASNDAISAAATDATNKSTAVAITVPKTVTGMPALPDAVNYPAGRLIYETILKRLYRSTGTAWEAATTDSSSLTGQLSDAQVSAIAASKVTGQLTNAQVSALDAAKLTGTLDVARVAQGSLDAKITALPTTKLTGTIGADLIAANSIYAGALTITNLDNLFPNPKTNPAFTGEWETNPTMVATSISALAPHGYVRILTVANTTMQQTNATPRIPVNSGDSFIFEADGAYASALGGQAVLTLWFYDGNASYLQGYASPSIVSGDYNAPSRVLVRGTAPVGAAFLIAGLQHSGGAIGQTTAWNNFYLRRMADGNLIVDGAITAAKIAANTITAGQIAANSITGDQIAANAITASELSAGAVVAGKIGAGAIVAADIAAGTITGNKLAANTITANQIAADTITAGQIAAGAIGASEIAAGTIYAHHLTVANFDNLIPNPKSDPTKVGLWETAPSLVSTSVYSLSPLGGFRLLTCVGTSAQQFISPEIPVNVGDEFNFEADGAYASAYGGTANITLWFYDENYSYMGGYASPSIVSGAYGAPSHVRVSGTAPAGAVWLRAGLQHSGGVNGQTTAWNNFNLRKCSDANVIVDGAITAQKIQATAVSTNNFAQATDSVNGGIYATAGAALVTNTATTPALITDKGGIKIGTRIFSDYWLRLLNALDGSASGGYFVYRGNIDTTTRGGVPDISLLHIYGCGSVWDGSVSDARYEYEIRPSATLQPGTDNLENLSHITMKCYTSSSSSLLMTRHVQLGFGRVFNAAAGANTANAHWGQFSLWTRGTNFCNGSGSQSDLWLRCQLFNAYGPSAERDYSPCSSEGAELGNSAISGTPSGGGGGGSGGGAGCPAPWVPITLASGLTIPAGSLSDGMEVIGVNDSTFEPTVGVIRDLQRNWVDKVSVVLEDGRAPEFTKTHRVATIDRGWQEVQNLIPGELLVAQKESRVKHVIHTGKGQVISFVVDGPHTYFSDDILSHNVKILS